MAWFPALLLLLGTVPLVDSSPAFIPPTCYSKVLSMAQEATQWAAYFKYHYETSECMAHMPELHLDVHNACVMFRMRTYVDLLDGLRGLRRCFTPQIHRLRNKLTQMLLIMSQKCHGDLVFTIYDCAALDRPGLY